MADESYRVSDANEAALATARARATLEAYEKQLSAPIEAARQQSDQSWTGEAAAAVESTLGMIDGVVAAAETYVAAMDTERTMAVTDEPKWLREAAEIEEAAYIDGASRYIVISKIVVPLAAPGIASVSIFCFIISWTEYLFASILISGDNLKTLPVGLAGIVGQYQIDWGFLLSGAVLASLPVIILFLFIGKYFVSGLTEGAVK